jgi:hypothetical protein
MKIRPGRLLLQKSWLKVAVEEKKETELGVRTGL